jgi:hypothetical protein
MDMRTREETVEQIRNQFVWVSVGIDHDTAEYRWDERNRLVWSSDSRHVVEYRYGNDGERSGKYSAGQSGGTSSETLYFSKLWTWRYGGQLSERYGRNSKHIYMGDSQKVSRADGSFTEEERF